MNFDSVDTQFSRLVSVKALRQLYIKRTNIYFLFSFQIFGNFKGICLRSRFYNLCTLIDIKDSMTLNSLKF